MRTSQTVFLAIVVLLLVGWGCGSADENPTDPGAPPPPGPPPPSGDTVLASGLLSLPAASVVGSSGDHEAFAVTHRLPSTLDGFSGARLVLVLRDRSRPGQACFSEAPEDGCATIDWSDDPSKPNVPAGGRFDNTLTMQLADGTRQYFLSANGDLTNVGGVIDPTREHTAISGGGVFWETTLPAEVVAGTDLQVRLFLTKWLDPAVEIAYEVTVTP